MPEASGVPSEHQFTRPDARPRVKAALPLWGVGALLAALLMGALAAAISFFLILFGPAMYLAVTGTPGWSSF